MLNKTKKIALSLAVPALALALPVAAFAQELVPSQIRPINDIIAVVRNAIRFILLVAFVLAFIFLLIGGIRWITAGGDEKAVSGARGMITAALIGLVIVLVSYALIVLVENFFNVSIISGPVVIPSVTDAP
ncbi:MAG: hypothetical protein AAB512_05210 [Patescibacteria group bacterium]